MTRVHVTVLKAGEPGSEPLKFRINGTRPDFEIGTERIHEWSVGHVDNRLLDLLDIAGAVFAVDGMVRRGGQSRPRLGTGWRRELHFDMDVRDQRFWNRRDTRNALAEAIEFLTDDAVSFRFGRAVAFTPRQDYLPFVASKPSLLADHVVLFSGATGSDV